MNENINLFEILKDCPENTEFYCSELDENVKFKGIEYAYFEGIIFMPYESYSMVDSDIAHYFICVNRYGSIFSKGKTPIIFPSKDQRDWSKWQCPKTKFDPKTLQPFDKVLVSIDNCWYCDIFSHIIEEERKCYLLGFGFCCCVITYNEDTKHLVGTTEEAPKYYRYWEE